MTGADIRKARAALGKTWSLGRPLQAAELGRLLGLRGRDPGATVLAWEAGTPVSGPVARSIEAWLDNPGYRPRTFADALARTQHLG